MNEGTRSEAGTKWRRNGRWSCLLSLIVFAGAAAAQPVGSNDAAQQRQRIAEQRAQAETTWQARRTTCADRFAVTPCMDAAEASYRQQVDALDRELDMLDTQQRRLRAAERLEIIRQKSEALAAGPGASGAGRALAWPSTDASAAAAQESSQRSAEREIEQRRAEAARQAAQRAAAARERRLEAERRRVDREQRRAGSRSGSASLPVPPAMPPAAASGPVR
jgi:colicin import membrane protein